MTATEASALLSPCHRSFIDGAFHDSTDSFTVRNPATDLVHAEVGAASLVDVERAILAARLAFDHGPWRHLSPENRALAVLRLVDHLASIEAELVDTIVAETGCPRKVTAAAQVGKPLAQARSAIDLFRALPDSVPNAVPLSEVVTDDRVTLSAMRFGPVGVVSAISAYNFPLHLSIWKVVPALLAGNAVVLRPSPLAPLTAFRFAEAAQAAGLPTGVLNVVAEPGNDGARLMTTHPAVDIVTFTGSSAVGRVIAAQAAPTLKRVLLELGGKSVGLYLPDGLHRVGDGVRAMFGNHGGQACVAQSRVLVPRQQHEEAVERMVSATATLRIGDPDDLGVEVGPLITVQQADRVAGYVREASAAGAVVLAGGGRPSGLAENLATPNFFEPTLLDCPDQTLPVVREEIFGPVVCVLTYDDLDEAVALANDSEYALSAGVYGAPATALAVAERIDAGTVTVNGGFASAFVSSGGWKQSGAGRERGVEGLRAFQRLKHLAISG
jgi:aldehyde dehydrogenase (NAD+)